MIVIKKNRILKKVVEIMSLFKPVTSHFTTWLVLSFFALPNLGLSMGSDEDLSKSFPHLSREEITYIDQDCGLKILDVPDAHELFNLIDSSRDHLRHFLPWLDHTKAPEDSKQFILGGLERYTQKSGIEVGIYYKGKLAGVIGFHHFDWTNRKTTIGYWNGVDYKGLGLVTKSCRYLVEYAFQELGMNRVEIKCAEKNLPSRAIPERLHFLEEGYLRENEWLYDHFVNHIVYGMVKKNWNQFSS